MSSADEGAPRPKHRAAIALGANLGDRETTLEAACRAIEALPGIEVLRRSTFVETDPVGGPPDQPRYLNGVLLAETIHPPRVLLRALKRIEAQHGRDRSAEVRNGPRTLDLDLLFVGDLRVSEPDLELPHPRMGEREFVLGPLAEIAPDEVLPGGRTVREALEHLRARGELRVVHDPDEAAAWCAAEREAGRSIGWVPVFEALHEGHLALVRAAAYECDRVFVSFTPNPLSRVKGSAPAPLDLDAQREALEAAGCALVWSGTAEQLFPGRLDVTGHLPQHLLEDPGPRAADLEGEARRGHLAGVATVLRRLAELTEADRVYLADRERQEAWVAQDLGAALGSLEVRILPVLRDSNGLALAAGNAELSDDERELARRISESLFAARELWRRGGERDVAKLSRALRAGLEVKGLELEYLTVRDPESRESGEPTGTLERAVAIVAVRIGEHRLTDSLDLSAAPVPTPSAG